ncbi:MAG: trimeric autotransporter adhesin [Gaiellaceae bacterium]|nr:trimeric autotransporter adhesin [Gaiellaceae bacterium]
MEMSRPLLALGLFGLLGLVGMLGAVSDSSAAPPPAWGTAIEVPGTAPTPNHGEGAGVSQFSCATAGNCAAVGSYTDSSAVSGTAGHTHAFVADEKNGSWGAAIDPPGLATLNTGGTAGLNSVSCATNGTCAAGGTYYTASSTHQAFVVDETNGTWGTAIEVPGTAALNTGGDASVYSVSCATAGNCAAVGTYRDSSGHNQAFVVNETNGTWGTAIQLPGTATLESGGRVVRDFVSCATPGNCAAVGSFVDDADFSEVFVADETNGTWGTAIQVPGMASANSGGQADAYSVSCATAGNCVIGGQYTDGAGSQAFLAAETNGVWGAAIEVPGTATLNSGGYAYVFSVSCPTPGNCAAAGGYNDGAGSVGQQAFVVDETNGNWGTAIEVPGTATLNSGNRAWADSISCATVHSCAVSGTYTGGSGSEAFVADETSGTWRTAIEVPGTAGLNAGGAAEATSVSCATAGDCVAGGYYQDSSLQFHAFVVGSTPVGATTLTPAAVAGVYRGTTTLSATLAFGAHPVAGETVSFTLNGTSVGSATTDANGVATLPNVSLAGIGPGSYPTGVAASFDGDGSPESASNGSSALTVYPAGLVGVSGVSVKTSGGKIDSFDSSLGPYSATTNHGSAALVMSNGTVGLAGVGLLGSTTSTQGAVTVASTGHVSGNVRAGTTASIAGTVGGTVTQHSPSLALQRPTVSACAPFSANTGISGGTFAYSASTGNLTVKMGTVKLANGTYCFHTIAFAAGTKLAVSGPVTIHLTGKITGSSGHIINSTNNPANLHIETSFVGSNGLVVAGGAHAYMTILAPSTSVTIPSGPVFGTLLSGTVSLLGGAAFHADTH